mmetsp:Transcript_96736/g.273286  ORF Transcript_96736/g.273286 Transcript_96736/m.273286 type:complete len:231 (+) Transcript_96736:428-1120(+)
MCRSASTAAAPAHRNYPRHWHRHLLAPGARKPPNAKPHPKCSVRASRMCPPPGRRNPASQHIPCTARRMEPLRCQPQVSPPLAVGLRAATSSAPPREPRDRPRYVRAPGAWWQRSPTCFDAQRQPSPCPHTSQPPAPPRALHARSPSRASDKTRSRRRLDPGDPPMRPEQHRGRKLPPRSEPRRSQRRPQAGLAAGNVAKSRPAFALAAGTYRSSPQAWLWNVPRSSSML